MLAQPRQQRPAGRIGQRREGAIQRLWLILNHVVKYRMAEACCQVRTLDAVRLPAFTARLSFRGPNEVRAPGIHNHRLRLWIPGSPLRGAPE